MHKWCDPCAISHMHLESLSLVVYVQIIFMHLHHAFSDSSGQSES